MDDDKFIKIAMDECRKGFSVGGIPVGACLVSKEGKLLSQGHNRLVQEGSRIKHAETAAIEAFALSKSPPPAASEYEGATVYTTLIPCVMCTGAMLLHKIGRVVYMWKDDVAEKPDTLALLRENGIEVVYKEQKESGEMLEKWIRENREIYEREPWAK